MGVLNTFRDGLNVLFTPVLYGVVASLAIQLATWEKGDRTQDRMQEEVNFKDKFDFIVVGGGTSGSVVANRLSEYYSVLLLEAGGEPNPLVNVPGLASHLLNRPEVDWMHKTVAQRRGSRLGQFKRASWAQGRGLGGSGNLDWMIGLRGSPRDFDNWAKLVGDEGWGYKKFLKYFQRHENFIGNTTDPAAHATGGELTIQLPDYRPLAAEFVWAGKELGYPNLDLNGRFTEGFDELFYTTKRGEKLSTYRAFLEPIKRRESLTIRRYAVVTKLLLNKKDNSVNGVEYERHNKKYTAYSTREVVLCAGTVQSPKILLLSGIGPKKHLEDVGIKTQVNLPIGHNLQDHLGVFLGPFFIKDPLSFNFDRDVTAKHFFEYGTFGQGPVTTTGYSATGFLASSFAKLRGEKGWPDLQLLMHGVSVHANYAADMAHSFGLQEDILKKYYKHASGRNSFHIVVSLARPYARGEVRLASRNPTAPLIIDPKYLEDPWEFDVKTLVEGVKKAVELVETTEKFQRLEGQFTNEALPGCESAGQFKSDEYWECYIRQFTVSMNNPVGTCSMGPRGSPHTVVDSELKVNGVKHLRIVDASIMPSIVIGGTSQATIAIAEKGVEHILREWKGKSKQVHFEKASAPVITEPPSVTIPTLVETTPKNLFASGNGFNFNSFLQQPQPQQTEQKQVNHWQEALDSIASFSRTIQQTLKVPQQQPSSVPPLLDITTPFITTTTTAKATTTTSRPPPNVHVQTNSPFHTPSLIFPPIKKFVVSTSTPPPFIPLPTQTSFRKIPVTVTSPSPTLYPAPTTYRPQFHEFNSTQGFSVNIPIIKSTTYKPSLQSQPKRYRPSKKPSDKYIHDIIEKEQSSAFEIQKPVSILPPRTTPEPVTLQTQPSLLQVTTRRPSFEVIQKEILPVKNYNNFVEIPYTRVNYFLADSTPVSLPSPTTTPSTSTASPSPTPPKAVIIPAISLPNPLLETTTARITSSPTFHHLAQTQMQSIPQQMFLAGLEPLRLLDMETATVVPQSSTSTISSYSTSTTSSEPPLFYVVRKKNKSPGVTYSQETTSLVPPPAAPQPPPRHRLRIRRPNKPFSRKPHSRLSGGRRPPAIMSAQSQRNFPVISLPPQQSAGGIRNLHSSINSHPLLHLMDSSREQQALQSSPVQIHSVLQNPLSSQDLSGLITPAISGPMYQQNVLNQLIPIQK